MLNAPKCFHSASPCVRACVRACVCPARRRYFFPSKLKGSKREEVRQPRTSPHPHRPTSPGALLATCCGAGIPDTLALFCALCTCNFFFKLACRAFMPSRTVSLVSRCTSPKRGEGQKTHASESTGDHHSPSRQSPHCSSFARPRRRRPRGWRPA